MNHKHTCPICDTVEVCDWGYDDEECAVWDEPILLCEPCNDAFKREASRFS